MVYSLFGFATFTHFSVNGINSNKAPLSMKCNLWCHFSTLTRNYAAERIYKLSYKYESEGCHSVEISLSIERAN